MSQIIKIEPAELALIPKEKSQQIRDLFLPMAESLSKLENRFNDIMADTEFGVEDDQVQLARKLKDDIAQVRIKTEKARKLKKSECLREGQAIDAAAKIVVWAVSDKEEKLKEIINHFEIEEKARLAALQIEREALLKPYIQEDFDRPLSDMGEGTWDAYIEGKKRDHNDRVQADIQAKKMKEDAEKIEREEQERVLAENARLQREADEAASKLRKATEEAEAVRAEDRRIAKVEQDAIDKQNAAQQKIIDDANALQLKIQQEREAAILTQNAKIQAENDRIKQDAVDKARKEREKSDKAEVERLKAEQDELNKGDEQKMIDLARALQELCVKYVFKSDKNISLYEDLDISVSEWIKCAHINLEDDDEVGL